MKQSIPVFKRSLNQPTKFTLHDEDDFVRFKELKNETQNENNLLLSKTET
jgi:hypothetical protein